jgi:manganese oxidase
MSVVRSRPAVVGACLVLFAAALPTLAAAFVSETSPSPVHANDNRRAAGTRDGATVTVALRASAGRWQPEGPDGPSLAIEAFGEVGKALAVPAPLLRVNEGDAIALSIRNELDHALVVNGLCARDGAPCLRLEVPPGETRAVRFASGRAGTYHYWASTIGAPMPFRELAGAFVVDPPAGPAAPDRIIVITEWTDLTAQQLGQIMSADDPTEVFVDVKPRLTFVMNGLSWPATERFEYQRGDQVRWRVINLSSQSHPLHLHGFYFDVDSVGNGQRDTIVEVTRRRRVVTQLMPSGGTLTMTWVPERAGNWLFHCHIMHHVSLARRLGPAADPHHASGSHAAHATTPGHGDRSLGMAGMVIGVTVREPERTPAAVVNPAPARQLTLVMQGIAGQTGQLPPAGFVLSDGERASASTPEATAPGPPIVLRRGEPVEITLVNRLTEATAIHWHGIELDSYYDGVHGWSGLGRRVTPMIEPGARFVVRFTPPRAGTFIYHTHLHDYRQLSSGLYGPIVVTEPDETFDAATDHVIVLGRAGLADERPSLLSEPDSVVVNGARAPRLAWKAGVRHRLRLINITPDDLFTVTLQAADSPLMWTPLAKDGEPVPAADAVASAARVTIAVGETYDFSFRAPEGRKAAWLEVRTTSGKWQAQAQIVIK